MSNNRFTKLSKNKIIKNIPSNRDGNIGDLQIIEIPQKGTFLCIKDKDGWKISDKFKPKHKFNIDEFNKITLSEVYGKTGKVFSLGTETISYTVNTNPGSETATSFNRPVLQVGNGTNSGVISSLGSKDLLLKSGNSSTSQIIIGSTDISADMSGGGTFNLRYNDTGSTSGEFSMMNVAAGDCYQNIQVTNAGKDTYTRYTYYADDPSNNIQWCHGMDGSDSDNSFKINYNASATALTPSNGTNVLKITDAGNVSTAGTLTIGSIATDTAGDNYLVEVSGVVKKRTPAETLADIGAQATVTAGTNCTFSGATLNVDDAFITNDADDTMAGTLTIDKDTTATTGGNTYGLNIDYDHTGICASGQSIRNYGISLAINSDSPTHVGSVLNFGIDNTVTAGTSGTQSSIGINNTVTGADTNTGIYQKVTDGGTDLKFVSSANISNYFSIATTADGATTIATVDASASAGHLTLQPDGDLKVIPNTGISTFFRGANTDDYFSIAVDGSGGAILSTTDAASNEAHLTFDVDGDIRLDSHTGNFIAKAAGTEFSADNSAYAGMILGYTRLEGDLTNQSTFEIQNSMTVEDSTHKITFKTPPSENVEIFASFCVDISSTDTEINVGLSDNATYNSVGQKFEYDNRGVFFSDDEANDIVSSAKWVLQASELADVGSSNTFYIGFSTSGATKTAYLRYGLRASHNITDHPFIIKATALPETIYDGS